MRLFRAVALASVVVASSAAGPANLASAADAGGAPIDSQVPTVSARADIQKARVGDVITLTVTSVSPSKVPVNLPAQVDLGKFSQLSRGFAEKDLGDGRMRREFIVKMAAYETGELEIPAIALTYLGQEGQVRSVMTDAVPVKVVSVLANEPNPVLKQNAPPVSVMEDIRWPLYVAGALGILAAGFVLGGVALRRMRARAAIRPAPPPRPPHEVALERLGRLGTAGFGTEGDFRPFYFEVSEIIREYMGGRFGFDSLELTTDELVAELRLRAAHDLVIGEVEGWMASCDLVKFANAAPTETEARGVLEAAIRFVNTTRPRVDAIPMTEGGGQPPAQETAPATAQEDRPEREPGGAVAKESHGA